MGRIKENPNLRDKNFVFKNRSHAGKEIAKKIENYKDSEAWIFAIPSGGVPIGTQLSQRLNLPLDLVIVRKIHIPWNPEAGFGSITWTGKTFFNEKLLSKINISQKEIEKQVKAEKREIENRNIKFRGNIHFPSIENKIVILTDDGMASGYSMLAAVKTVQKRKAKKIIVAVPTCSESSIQKIIPEVDELVCLNIRKGPRFAVASAYEDWYDLSDNEVIELLKKSEKYRPNL